MSGHPADAMDVRPWFHWDAEAPRGSGMLTRHSGDAQVTMAPGGAPIGAYPPSLGKSKGKGKVKRKDVDEHMQGKSKVNGKGEVKGKDAATVKGTEVGKAKGRSAGTDDKDVPKGKGKGIGQLRVEDAISGREVMGKDMAEVKGKGIGKAKDERSANGKGKDTVEAKGRGMGQVKGEDDVDVKGKDVEEDGEAKSERSAKQGQEKGEDDIRGKQVKSKDMAEVKGKGIGKAKDERSANGKGKDTVEVKGMGIGQVKCEDDVEVQHEDVAEATGKGIVKAKGERTASRKGHRHTADVKDKGVGRVQDQDADEVTDIEDHVTFKDDVANVKGEKNIKGQGKGKGKGMDAKANIKGVSTTFSQAKCATDAEPPSPVSTTATAEHLWASPGKGSCVSATSTCASPDFASLKEMGAACARAEALPQHRWLAASKQESCTSLPGPPIDLAWTAALEQALHGPLDDSSKQDLGPQLRSQSPGAAKTRWAKHRREQRGNHHE
ncbi:unnamed protein product [Symbiodinium natans]|uniref:Uncharacterized protein n=1 Tax=Symbiodinium natans TaxID=878477 RepID=A0A812H9P5_9DINO|nr:unnamed protein product [Symbiodinium natans]